MESRQPDTPQNAPVKITPVKAAVSQVANSSAIPKNNPSTGISSNNYSTTHSKDSQAEYFYISSPEFKAFWGQKISSLWFAPRKKITIPRIVLGVITMFAIYLSSLLLFSPMELIRMVTYQASSTKIDDKVINGILRKYR